MSLSGNELRQSRARKVRQAVLEVLEPRRLLSVDMVTNLNDSGAGSLRQTIASASAGDTIQFASALSGGTITLITGELAINENLTITGLGSASLTISGSNTSTDFAIGSKANVSISGLTITAGNAGPTGNGGDLFNSGTLTLTGDVISNGYAQLGGGLYNNAGVVTISGGTLSGSEAVEQGGGILNAPGGTINLTGTTFSSNQTAQEAGGAIANESGTMTLTMCTVTGNSAGTDGAGIANLSGSTMIVNDTAVTSNFADMWGAGIFNFANATITINNGSDIASNITFNYFGGGIFNYEGTVNLANSTISSNFALAIGAGMMSFLGTLNISGTTFTGNGSSSVDAGGGLYTMDDLATITNCIFTGNQADYGAAIYVDSSGFLALSQSTIQNNTAQQDGGGIYMAGQGYFSDCTIANNTADDDGGGIINIGTLGLASDTIAANVADNIGGGLFIGGETTAYNTIVATNTQLNTTTDVSFPSDVINTFDSSLSQGESPSQNDLIGTGGSGGLTNGKNGNKVGVNPDLGPLQFNGGSESNLDTMALLTGSPAINAGNNSLLLDAFGNAIATDERGTGFARVVNGTTDIGSYEVQSNATMGSSQPSAIVTHVLTATTPAAPAALTGAGKLTPDFSGLTPAVSAAASPYTPAEIRGAYGVNDIFFNGVTGNGAGQTIAIVDAYNDPDIISDANTFSADFGLPQFNGLGDPTLKVLNQTGGTTLPQNASPGDWDVEESLDVEWSHAIAPDANIILFEANSNSDADLFTTVTTAAATPGVSVVSMSFSESQLGDLYSNVNEPSFDSTFTTPAGHQGVTFLGSTGDDGAVAVGYPSLSPNVVSVGGTSLTVGTDDSYLGESAWSGGGGGLSFEESQPSYQAGKVNNVTTEVRATPDVSMDAAPQTGVIIIDSFDTSAPSNEFDIGGTSLATPMWAALIAIVDQGRALKNESSLDGPSQTLPMLYALSSSDFHDITTGDNGYAATPGYDLATGLGSPIANLLVPAMAGFNGTAVWTGAVSNAWYNPNNWNTFSVPNSTTDVIINSGNPVAVIGFSIGTLTLNGGDLQLGMGSGNSTATSLTMSNTATLDVENNKLFIDYGSGPNPIATIAGYVTSGYHGGAWNGAGIDSSIAAVNPAYAVGYAGSADTGNPANLATNQIEIAFTLYGDANLNGTVDGTDLGIVSANFNKGVTGWDQGDFNYNNVVDGTDFGLLASNFNHGASLAAAATPIANSADSPVQITSSPTATPVNPLLDPTTSIGSKTFKTKTSAKSVSSASHHSTPPKPTPPPLVHSYNKKK